MKIYRLKMETIPVRGMTFTDEKYFTTKGKAELYYSEAMQRGFVLNDRFDFLELDKYEYTGWHSITEFELYDK